MRKGSVKNDTMRSNLIPTLLYMVVLWFLCNGCATYTSNSTAQKSGSANQAATTEPQVPSASVTRIKANLIEPTSREWLFKEKRTTGREDLRSVYFLNDTTGWAGGRGVLYHTTDAGETWRKLSLEIHSDAYVTQIIFRNTLTGWALVQRDGDASSPGDSQFWLLFTMDGGETWTTQLDIVATVATGIRLGKDREVWLVGTKYSTAGGLEHRNLLLHTLDEGNHWDDVSEQLIQAADNAPIRLTLTDVAPEVSLTADVLMHEGSVFRTGDGGRSWQRTNATIDNDAYVCFCQMGFTENGSLWASGGKDDKKSVLGLFALREDKNWKEFLLSGVYFSNVHFLSQNQILGAGSSTPDQNSAFTDKRHATILFSSDAGATWTRVYKSPRAKKFYGMAAPSTRKFYAVSDEGLIVLIYRHE